MSRQYTFATYIDWQTLLDRIDPQTALILSEKLESLIDENRPFRYVTFSVDRLGDIDSMSSPRPLHY